MKKTLLSLTLLFLLVPPAMAATIVSNYSVNLIQYEDKALAPVIITSTADGDITAEHGIRILLTETEKILFDKRELNFIGSAVDNGRVGLNVQAVFSADYKSLFIPVLQDFEAGDWLQIQGLALRSYDDVFGSRYLGLDLNGDFVAEINDIYRYRVIDSEKSDITDPYPVTDINYLINKDGSVTFTWKRPPDYDYLRTIINRTRIKNGLSQLSSVYYDADEFFTDTDLQDVTSASYSFIATDKKSNWSEPVVVEIDFTTPVEEPATEEPEKPAELSDVPESEAEELSKLLNYYNVRYSIKCMPSGVAAPENNSACLWARIDLVYAQGV
ncbi:MAG: hypothetical protein KJ597_07535, partial [Nanoarchaeota archaeon]|nr:hypothetical protein [Nanoarchaeota archaeon]